MWVKSGYQRRIHHLLNRGETRNSLARDVFHGHRGQLRKHYQVGQENQLDTLGIMINILVLWQTVYIQAALDHLATNGHHPDPDPALISDSSSGTAPGVTVIERPSFTGVGQHDHGGDPSDPWTAPSAYLGGRRQSHIVGTR